MGEQIRQRKPVAELEKYLDDKIRGVSELVDDNIREFMLFDWRG